MRTTVRIDDDLLSDLKDVAKKEKISLTKAFNKVLDAGLRSKVSTAKSRSPYRVRAVSMGKPLLDLTKANQLAAELEDEETIRNLRPGK